MTALQAYIGIVIAFVCAAFALAVAPSKRVLIFAGISAAGWCLFAAGSGVHMALALAVSFAIAQILGLAGIFVAGNSSLQNPVTKTGYLLCAFSVAGIPPCFGFWPRLLIIMETVQAGAVWQAAALILATLFILFSLFRGSEKVISGDEKIPLSSYISLSLGAACLVLGFGFKPAIAVIQSILL